MRVPFGSRYFTSRPSFKYYVREASRLLQTARQLVTFAGVTGRRSCLRFCSQKRLGDFERPVESP